MANERTLARRQQRAKLKKLRNEQIVRLEQSRDQLLARVQQLEAENADLKAKAGR